MRALVVGGGSGIGLAVVKELLDKGIEKVYIVSKNVPDFKALGNNYSDYKTKISYIKHNLINYNEEIFDFAEKIDILIITAGFGRVAPFEQLSEAEVKNLLQVNFEAPARIIKKYYSKISGNNNFYSAVLVSICGQIVSPLFSAYGAAKGGLRFLIENLNCELQAKGCANRILDVSPGSLNGTAFNGGANDLTKLQEISKSIVQQMFDRKTLFIPKYDEIYKNVLTRYSENKEKFGQESYQFKISNNRIVDKPQVVVGYLSGTFDLFHIGHLNLLKRAKEECDYLIVSIHKSGSWKGKETFIPYDERCEIVKSIKYVDEIVEDYEEDSDAWNVYHYDKLFVGSDYKGTERFNRYEKILHGKAEIIYFPYTKETSSTELRAAIKKDSDSSK